MQVVDADAAVLIRALKTDKAYRRAVSLTHVFSWNIQIIYKNKKSHAYSNPAIQVMSTWIQIAQMPRSCALMDAKSGKSFLVTGMSSGIDRQVEVESSGNLGQKKVTRL